MVKLRKKAKFWRKIHQWQGWEPAAFYFCKPTKPADWTEAVFVRAQKDPDAIKFLSAEASLPMQRLLDLAGMGKTDAAKIAIELVEEFVRTLNLYAKLTPETFRKATGQLTHWPAMLSGNPNINQARLEIAKNAGVGADYPFPLDPKAEWDPQERGCKIAIKLYQYLETIRRYPENHRGMGIVYEDSVELPPFVKTAARLPKITEFGAARKWWDVARAVILFYYPDPRLEEKLNVLTAIKSPPSKVNDKILDCLKRRFMKLFPSKYR